MKLETVYDKEGNVLGAEYVNLIGLQQDTKLAISQIYSLDEKVGIYNTAVYTMSQPEQAG